jgi:hypothetical protein
MDINIQYLDKLYEDIHRETLNLINQMKNRTQLEPDNDKDIIKQTSIYNTLLINIVKLKKMKEKALIKNIA